MSMVGNFALITGEQVAALLGTPGTLSTLVQGENLSERYHRVDDNWHAMHFLFNGSASTGKPPLDFILAGGAEVADSDHGYGPARVFSPAALDEIVRALGAITDQQLRANYSPEALEISPHFTSQAVDAVLASCRDLQAFLESAPQRGLLIWLD
jgi:hypothetical protein